MEYVSDVFKIYRTKIFINWLSQLKDRRAAARIASRMLRAEDGNLGDVKFVGDGVGEMRIDYGPGYRIYFIRNGQVVIVLLCGGDKSTQQKDIGEAKRLAKEWKDQQP
ncbi:MAG: type II toxin-antitoxin system RelE/ParE family toxin [Rhizobiaceae bacterium]|nr:type II toxin-antitoxin system RelE/ParE family toxin [Rhizobiaceae bacterium]